MTECYDAEPERLREMVRFLLEPENIVLVGASPKDTRRAGRIWQHAQEGGYSGAVYPVNPKYETLWGIPCYPSLHDLPEKPDHVVVRIPAPGVPEIARSAAATGARSMTIFSAGFGEGGDAGGRELSTVVRDVVGSAGIALSGPNCGGNWRATSGLLTAMLKRFPADGGAPVALVAQSGGVIMFLYESLFDRGIPVRTTVSTGNELGLVTADYIDFLASDPDTKIILCYIEAVRNVERFIAACNRARENGKWVIALKVGASPEGREAARAHTGALTGSAVIFKKIMENAGVVCVDNLDEMIEATEYLLHCPTPPGPRAAVLTHSGGLRELFADVAYVNGLPLARLSQSTLQKLSKLVGTGGSVGNPTDCGFVGLSNLNVFLECVKIMASDPNVDVILAQEELPRSTEIDREPRYLIALDHVAEELNKPLAVFSMASLSLSDFARDFKKRIPNIATLQEASRSARIVGTAGRIAAQTNGLAVTHRSVSGGDGRPAGATGSAQPAGPIEGAVTLDEVQSKEVLQYYGLAVPTEATALTAEQAAQAAERLGFPVVAKIISGEIVHKAKAGGVRQGLTDPHAVRSAVEEMFERVGRPADGGSVRGVLIAEQVVTDLEVFVGVRTDVEFGPIVAVAVGGSELEANSDAVAIEIAPISKEKAVALLERTLFWEELLAGREWYEVPSAKGLVEAVVSAGKLAKDLEGLIIECDMNPISVQSGRRSAVVLDSNIVVRDSNSADSLARLAAGELPVDQEKSRHR